jgi:ribose transport system substrate-binding protein
VQNPVNMGYLSIRTMVDHLQGRRVAPQVDTGVMMVTVDNLNAPDVVAVIHPPGADSQ